MKSFPKVQLWNLHYNRRHNSLVLEELIDSFWLLINNESRQFTCQTSKRVSDIDSTLTICKHGLLTLWKIPEEYPALSDHKPTFTTR